MASTLCEYPQITITPTDPLTNDFHKITRDKVYQLHAHGWWFSPCTLASFATETDYHDVAEIVLTVMLNTKNQINASCNVVNRINKKNYDIVDTYNVHIFILTHIYPVFKN